MKRSSQWETIRHDDILDCFPILSEDDIGDIALGNELVFFTVFFNWNVLDPTLKNDARRRIKPQYHIILYNDVDWYLTWFVYQLNQRTATEQHIILQYNLQHIKSSVGGAIVTLALE
jgi:hypothetical protein